MTDDEALIAQIEQSSKKYKHVGDAGAYEHFASGGLVFDTSPNAELLEEFCEAAKAEFGAQITRPFRWEMKQGRKVYSTFHKHKGTEALIPDLQNFESESYDNTSDAEHE